MRTKYKLLLLALLANICLLIGSKVIFGTVAVIIAVLLLELIGLTGIYIFNKIIRSSEWFKQLHADFSHERYPDNEWYRKHDERNIDLVNTGSLCAKYAFCYSDENVKAMNWSAGVQTLFDDYKLVRNFHSILKRNGTVLITVMPFTSINKKTGFQEAFRFYTSVDWTLTSEEYRQKCERYENYPVLFGKQAIKAGIRKMIGREKSGKELDSVEYNPMSDSELDEDAERWIMGWKRQFAIEDIEENLTVENEKGRKIRVEVMQNMVDFLWDRGYRVVWIIPPVSEFLSVKFTSQFKEKYIYRYLKDVDRNVPILDYLEGDEFKEKDLYFNSYFMNKRGAKLFTHKVIEDLKDINML